MLKNVQDDSLVVVNANALATSGALTILNQFLEQAVLDKKHRYVCFIHESVEKKDENNILFISVKKKGLIKRVLWDLFGFNHYLKLHNLKPKKVISLQNTSVWTKYKQIIYLHQSIPFSDIRLGLSKSNLKFFMYKYIYPYFIFFKTKNTVFVVQTNWMKDSLINKIGVSEDRIHVLKPNISVPNIDRVNLSQIKDRTTKNACFIYPATPMFYKNHLVLIEAFNLLKKEGCLQDSKLLLTFNHSTALDIEQKIKEYQLDEHVVLLGVVPYNELFDKYYLVDAILFPSYLESFGLPLAEGAMLGKYIICSDLPYARDVLSDYPRANYIKYDDAAAWAAAINKVILNKEQIANSELISNFKYEHGTSWADFFKLI